MPRIFGRPTRLGRPQNYTKPPNGEVAAMDLKPLREKGMLPNDDECGKALS